MHKITIRLLAAAALLLPALAQPNQSANPLVGGDVFRGAIVSFVPVWGDRDPVDELAVGARDGAR